MTACQRWNPGRVQSWRSPSDGGFDPGRYVVTSIGEAAAKAFVTGWHYSGTYPAALHRFGLEDLSTAALAGVAVLSVPVRREVLTGVFPGLEPYAESCELGRFVLDDSVPANGESWFWAECRRLAAMAGVRGVVAFSDPVPRATATGVVVKRGHIGFVYQASNARYLDRSTPRTLTLLPDATVFSDRAASKIRAQDRGHAYAEAQLVGFGATPRRPGQRPAVWLARALDEVGARRVRHPGNHSTGLGMIVGALKRARACGGSVAIAACSERALKVFRITGLVKVFPVYDTVEEAIAAESAHCGAVQGG